MFGGECITLFFEIRNAHKILVGKPKEKRPLADMGLDWNVMDFEPL
jgi:hypothetical protein